MRSTTTLALTLTLFAGILSAGEPVPLPIEEDSRPDLVDKKSVLTSARGHTAIK